MQYKGQALETEDSQSLARNMTTTHVFLCCPTATLQSAKNGHVKDTKAYQRTTPQPCTLEHTPIPPHWQSTSQVWRFLNGQATSLATHMLVRLTNRASSEKMNPSVCLRGTEYEDRLLHRDALLQSLISCAGQRIAPRSARCASSSAIKMCTQTKGTSPSGSRQFFC